MPTEVKPGDAQQPEGGAVVPAPGEKPTAPVTPQEGDKPKVEFKDLDETTQSFFRELRKENERLRKDLAKREEDERAKQDEDLKSQNQWKELAERRESELGALKARSDEADQLGELLTKQINAEIAKWPEEVKATAPEGEVAPLEMVKWLERTRPLAEKLISLSQGTPTPKERKPGNGMGPTPTAQTPTPAAATDDPANVRGRF